MHLEIGVRSVWCVGVGDGVRVEHLHGECRCEVCVMQKMMYVWNTFMCEVCGVQEMMYVWNAFTVLACCESLVDAVLDNVNTTLTDLTQQRSEPRRRYFYDDFCLAMLIRGVCLRHKRNFDDALACFESIVTQ